MAATFWKHLLRAKRAHPIHGLILNLMSRMQIHFNFLPALWVGSNGNYGNPLDWAFYDIPFPLGNDKSRHIEYETNDGLIAFDVLDDKADGRHVIRVTDCPHLECTGVFVSGAENLSDNFIQ